MTPGAREFRTRFDQGPPQNTGSRRIVWQAVPAHVRAAIERLLGDTVCSAPSQPGGFSDGLAARLQLASGRRVFVKAAVADFHRREIAVAGRLPDSAPVPRLLHSYDDGDWVALIYEDIPGRLPAQPWHPDELDRVLTAVAELARTLTPSPVDPAVLGRPRLGGWSALASRTDAVSKRDPWAADHLADLIALEADGVRSTAGETLLHGDLYPFNIMLTDSQVYFVDWPHAWIGAAHCDAVTLMSNARLSGIDPQSIVRAHPLTRDLDPVRIDEVLAMHAGFLMNVVVSAEPTADRNLLDMMNALAGASLDWLRERRS